MSDPLAGIAGAPADVDAGAAAPAEATPALGPVRVPKDLGWDDDALRRFEADMPRLVKEGQDPVDADYQRLLYGVAHEFAPGHLDMIDDFLGLPHPDWSRADKEDAIEFLDAAGYPETEMLPHLPHVAGLTLAHVAGYLHFFHHVFVPYDEATCTGLARLGVAVPYTEEVDADVYAAYTEAVEELKERLPYWDFPERNLSLQRVVQVALQRHGAAHEP